MHAWALEAQRSCGGRVTRAETIHLTLVFLGEVPDHELSGAIQAARRVTCDRLVLPMEQAKFWRHNRIVWAGPRETPARLGILVDDLKKELAGMEIKTERRPFAAHVTVIRKARTPGELPQLTAVRWPVKEFVLVRSRLSSAGPGYEVVSRFPLS